MRSLILFFIIFFSLTACSKYSKQVAKEYDSHNYTQLYKTLQKAMRHKDNDYLLWQMQSAFLTFSHIAPYFSVDELERAESTFKVYESRGILSGFSANVAASLSNDLAIPYRGYIFEGALLNFYKALSLSSIGDNANARVEFNRANDRQRRAKDYYAKEIKKAHDEAIKEANKEEKSSLYEKNTNEKQIDKILSTKYSNLSNYIVYENLINPVIPYISGLFFMIEKDYPKSQDLLKEAYGISRAKVIADDMNILESRKWSKDFQTYTWIIIEDGNLARKIELKDSIPILLSSGANALNFALPHLVEGKKSFSNYSANGARANMIASTSGVFASEFKKHLSSIITRAIISTIVKYAITETLNQSGQYGQILGLFSTLTFMATNKADTRSSIFLGDSFYVIRIPNTHSHIQLFGDNALIVTLQLNNECQSLQNHVSKALAFKNLVEKKPKNLSAKIDFFKQYHYDSVLCSHSDNIVYMRSHDRIVSHFIVKGE